MEEIPARPPQLTLDVANAQLKLEQASLAELQVELSQSKRDLQRMESLVSSSTVSRQRYDAAHDTYINLKAETRLQQVRVDRQFREKAVQAYEVEQYTVRPPLDGLIVRRMAQPGQGTVTILKKQYDCHIFKLKTPEGESTYWIAQDDLGPFLVKESGTDQDGPYEVIMRDSKEQ